MRCRTCERPIHQDRNDDWAHDNYIRGNTHPAEPFTCVKPVGFTAKRDEGGHPVGGGQFVAHGELATYQLRGAFKSGTTWCTAHVEAGPGHRHEWILIDSPEAARDRKEYADIMAQLKTKQEADERWKAEHPELMALAEAVHQYAVEHYSDGWDVIVECWEQIEIARSLAEGDPVPTTVEVAVDSFRGFVSVWADRQADARNSAF